MIDGHDYISIFADVPEVPVITSTKGAKKGVLGLLFSLSPLFSALTLKVRTIPSASN